MAAGAFPPAVREQVLARSRGMCERCGGWRVEQIHHRRPRGMGGSRAHTTATAANAFGLCGTCHLWVETHRLDALEWGYLVSQGTDPVDVPVWYMHTYWCTLSEDGTIIRNTPGD